NEAFMIVLDANTPPPGASRLIYEPPDDDEEAGGRPIGEDDPTPEQGIDRALAGRTGGGMPSSGDARYPVARIGGVCRSVGSGRGSVCTAGPTRRERSARPVATDRRGGREDRDIRRRSRGSAREVVLHERRLAKAAGQARAGRGENLRPDGAVDRIG